MKRRARSRDTDPAAFGAEALPGGLRQIDEARSKHDASAARPARIPLLGLAALIRLWRARGRGWSG